MKKGLGLCLTLLLTFGIYETVEPKTSLQNRFVPPDGKTLLIIGQDVHTIDDYLKTVRVPPSGFATYTSVDLVGGLESALDQGGGVQHAQKLVESHPHSVLQIGLWMVNSLQLVHEGDLDDSIDHLGQWIQQTKRPVYLRIGYEFDYPENHYQPADYVKAWRYIVDRFRRKGVNNVAYVWHSFAGYLKKSHTDWYPGDDYVDWFAISFFRQHENYRIKFAKLAEKHGKPLMIAEASPWHIPTTLGAEAWKTWYAKLFHFAREYDVKALSYINCNWDDMDLFRHHNWGNAAVQENEYVKEQWTAEISKEKYLQASPTLFQLLGYNENLKASR